MSFSMRFIYLIKIMLKTDILYSPMEDISCKNLFGAEHSFQID